jgi:hypothetical protein
MASGGPRGRLLVTSNYYSERGYENYYEGNVSQSEAYAASAGSEKYSSDIGIFLLASFQNAVALGETKDIPFVKVDYFYRAVAARATWASHAKVFFMVTGSERAENRVIRNETNCRNLSDHFTNILGGKTSQEVYKCAEIMVLHLPQCEGTGWGPAGPCCRYAWYGSLVIVYWLF